MAGEIYKVFNVVVVLFYCINWTAGNECHNGHNRGKYSQYRGRWSCSASGYACQHWVDDIPNRHSKHGSQGFPADVSEKAAVNYCRDPDRSGYHWCYTVTNRRWQKCNVPVCSGRFCPGGKYGGSCEKDCGHCLNDLPCDRTSGQCPCGCTAGWSGDDCKQVTCPDAAEACSWDNVALYGNASQPNKRTHFYASRAVDGVAKQDFTLGFCSSTGRNSPNVTAEWSLDFGKDTAIKYIVIHLRQTRTVRSRGFQLIISNGTLERRCYEDDVSSSPSATFSMMCPYEGRSVVVRNENIATGENGTYLEICEVEVYVCNPGAFGEFCQKRCHCEGPTCDPYTGYCPGGCTLGWGTQRCNESCVAGTYGYNCNETCPNCFNGTCDKFTGICPSDCNAGWMGSYCNTPCDTGYYGDNCTSLCGHCAGVNGNATCNHTTGFCEDCSDGWIPPYCQEPCIAGTYGYSCNETCPNCINGTCDKFTGICLGDCKAGWMGSYCNTRCTHGTYGHNCESQCGNCVVKGSGSTCHYESGSCDECYAGWELPYCHYPCNNNRYGKNCSLLCGYCVSDYCNPETGICEKGCVPGWTEPYCQSEITCVGGMVPVTVAIAGGIVAAIIIITLVLIIIILWRRISKENGLKRQNNQAVSAPVTAGSTDRFQHNIIGTSTDGHTEENQSPEAETYMQISTENRETEQEYTQLQIVPLCSDYELEPVSREDNYYVNTAISME